MVADIGHCSVRSCSPDICRAVGDGGCGAGLVVMRLIPTIERVCAAFTRSMDQPASVAALELRVEDLALGYRGRAAFTGLTGCFAAGSLTAVIGANGSGKTSLLQGLAQLLRPMRGRVHCPLPLRGMAYLSQVHEINREAAITVEDFVALGLWQRTGSLRGVTVQGRDCVDAAIAALGLIGLERDWISDLSGGQFQRVRFARLLVQNAPVVLLDEPFTGIDAPTVAALMALIERWHARGTLVIAVLHDLETVRQHFPSTLWLKGAESAWGATGDVLPQPARASHVDSLASAFA